MEKQSKKIPSLNLLCAVLIELKERGIAKRGSSNTVGFPLGFNTEKILYRSYLEASNKFPEEMDYNFLKRANPYCHDLSESLHFLRVSGNVNWLDDGTTYFVNEEIASEFLDPNKIPDYSKVKKVASFIVERANIY